MMFVLGTSFVRTNKHVYIHFKFIVITAVYIYTYM